jgi:hypothetical protein
MLAYEVEIAGVAAFSINQYRRPVHRVEIAREIVWTCSFSNKYV